MTSSLQQWQIDRINDKNMSYYRHIYEGSLRLLSGRMNLDGKHVVVYCEQGIGDIIQMLRFIPFLLDLGCKLTLHCPSSLHRLVRSIWEVDVLEKSNGELPEHDFHILSMDLPTLFKFCNGTYILSHEKEEEVASISNSVGICWEGNPDHPMNLTRSCPLHYFKCIDATLVSLQSQLYLPQENCEDFNLLGSPQKDLYDTAKLINSVDKVVTVDTAVLHLAGAMRKETYGLLATPCDPRWGKEKNTTLWYPSVKFIRQKTEGDWSSVFEELLETKYF